MTKGGKLFIPKCEYFTTGGYMCLFNCPYKTEQKVKTGTRIPWNLLYPLETDKDKEIARLTAENKRLKEEIDYVGKWKEQAEKEKADKNKWKCTANDWEQRAESREKQLAELRTTSCEVVILKDKVISQQKEQIARLIAENERLRTENAELIKSDTSKEHCIIEEHNEVHYWRYRAKQAEEDVCLREKEIIELNASLSKMEIVEKELTDRLKNAVELPFIIHVSNNYAVIVYVDENGKIHKTHTYATKEAEARLAELKGE